MSLTEARDGVSKERFFWHRNWPFRKQQIFQTPERMDTGGRWSTVTGVSTFGVGLIRATFQTCGKYSLEIQLLMIAVIGPTKCSAASFTNRAGS